MVPIGTPLTAGSAFSLPGDVQAMAAQGNTLYLCLNIGDPHTNTMLFYVVDASDVANPRVVGTALDHGNYGYLYGLALYGSYAYVDTYNKGLVVLDISNPQAPKVLATYDTLAAIPMGISGSHLFALGYGLDYLSLADPVHPTREGRLLHANVLNNMASPWDETRCAFIRYDNDQINLVDFSIPASPRIVAKSKAVNLKGIVTSSGSLFGITDIPSPTVLQFVWKGTDSLSQAAKAELPGAGECIAVLGNRVVAGGVAGPDSNNLFLLSSTGPQSPYVVGSCNLPLSPGSLTADGNRIYAYLGYREYVAVEVGGT